MKVYVAIGSYNYEGYGEPIGVYSSPDLAEAAAKRDRRFYDDTEVMEYDLDGAATPNQEQPTQETAK